MLNQDDVDFEAPNSDPGKLYIKFDLHPVENTERTAQEGRPIYDDVEYIRIVVPGDKNNAIHRPVTLQDKRDYAKQYAAFKAGLDQDAVTGTLLEHWAGITRAQVEELRYFKVRTVEQLAELSDGNLQNIGPILSLRQKAKDFITKARGAAPVAKLRAEMEQKDARISALEDQVKKLIEKFGPADSAAPAAETPKRGKGKRASA